MMDMTDEVYLKRRIAYWMQRKSPHRDHMLFMLEKQLDKEQEKTEQKEKDT